MCVEDFRNVPVEAQAVPERGIGLLQGQEMRGSRFQVIPQKCPKHVPAIEHIQCRHLRIAAVQIEFMAGDCPVDDNFLIYLRPWEP